MKVATDLSSPDLNKPYHLEETSSKALGFDTDCTPE